LRKITITAVGDLVSLCVDWTGMAQKIKIASSVFRLKSMLSHESWQTACIRPRLFGL